VWFGQQQTGEGLFFGLFSTHYILCLVYGVVLLATGFMRFRWRISYGSIRYSLLWLVLFLISAYALNREIPVFQESTGWLSGYVIFASAACIAYGFYERLPVAGRLVVFFALGAAFVLFVYLALYLMPFYAVGLMAFFVLGISLHAFVPLLFVVYLTVLFFREAKTKAYRRALAAGIGLPLLFAAYFSVQWYAVIQKQESAQLALFNRPDVRLPTWVVIGQNLGKDWVAERLLKAELVYDTPIRNGRFDLIPSRTSFNEVRQHDPLVVIADFFFPAPLLEAEDRLKILEAVVGQGFGNGTRCHADPHLPRLPPGLHRKDADHSQYRLPKPLAQQRAGSHLHILPARRLGRHVALPVDQWQGGARLPDHPEQGRLGVPHGGGRGSPRPVRGALAGRQHGVGAGVSLHAVRKPPLQDWRHLASAQGKR
jgi:XrtN system VIT domain protein